MSIESSFFINQIENTLFTLSCRLHIPSKILTMILSEGLICVGDCCVQLLGCFFNF